MIKKILIFLILSITCFGKINKISNIKDLQAIVMEKTELNGEIREKEYTIKYISSDYLRKEVLLPKINKGEIYQYENNKRYVYIPLFDEVTEEKSNDEFNNFLTIINQLKSKDKTDKEFSKNYYSKKIVELKFKDTYSIKIKKFKEIDNYLLPIELEIYDGKIKISTIRLKDIKVNSSLKREELNR